MMAVKVCAMEPRKDSPVNLDDYTRLLDMIQQCEQSHAEAAEAAKAATSAELERLKALQEARKAFAAYIADHQPRLAEEIRRRVR